MITVTIWRKTLVRLGACSEGLRAFDALCAMQPSEDPLRSKRLKVSRWSPLHAVWIRAIHPSHAAWLESHDLIPRANCGAPGGRCRDACPSLDTGAA